MFISKGICNCSIDIKLHKKIDVMFILNFKNNLNLRLNINTFLSIDI